MSHLACADEAAHSMNAQQLSLFHTLTVGTGIARSLAATGGILLGHPYHFELTRPGIGIYGGAPFAQARPVVALDLPVVQARVIPAGASVGYGASWIAPRESVIATVSAGYADGLPRALGRPRAEGAGFALWAGDQPCPVVGRVSMDLITVDVTDLPEVPAALSVLGPRQGIDALAEQAGTIGYEILTSLGARYARRHLGGG